MTINHIKPFVQTFRHTHTEWMTMMFPHESNVEDMLIHNCTISGSPVLEVGEFQILNTRQETECSVAESVARSVVEAAAPVVVVGAPHPSLCFPPFVLQPTGRREW